MIRKGEENMIVNIYKTKQEMGKAAAERAGEILIDAIKKKGEATFVAATGASQFEFLEHLTSISSIDWSKTTMFHLDEYIGIPSDHPASFRKYLRERLINKVHPKNVYLINGDAVDPEKECERLSNIISQKEIDVSFVGIGENCHIAFNDPPADFEIDKPYIIVNLDKTARNQQVREGWFKSLDEVPKQAISMSIKYILRSRNIVCVVPDSRKAEAVEKTLNEEISPYCPASILKKHESTFMFLDEYSSRLLNKVERPTFLNRNF